MLRLSATQLDMFFRCGEQWRRRYIEKEIVPPGIAAHVGSGVHAGAEVNFRQKIDTHEDLPLSDVQDAARDGYLHQLKKRGVYLTRDDATRKVELFNQGLDQAVDAVTVLHTKMAPAIVPARVELELVAVDEEIGVEWLGYADLVEDNATLHDIKTTGKAWSQADVDASTQGTLYPWLYERVLGEPPAQIEFDIFRKLKSGTKYSCLFTERDSSDWRAFQAKVQMMIRMVEAGLAPPAEAGSWVCSETWCGWWSTCKYISDRRRRLPNV